MRSSRDLSSRTIAALAVALALPVAQSSHAADAGATAQARNGPIGGSGTVQLEPVEPAPPARTHRLVFACVGDGVPVTFSDRPCGPASTTRELRFTPPASPRVVAPPRATAPRGPGPDGTAARVRRIPPASPVEPPAEERAAECLRLEEAVASLDQHMRAGYSARESGRLWARWREAKERLRKSGC